MASTDDLTRSVETGSYKKEPDDRLYELIAASLNVQGSNPIALHRITHAADILKKELEARKSARSEEAQQDRHRSIERSLAELKKPHWSVSPNFWMTLAILILTAIGATAAVMALFKN